MFCGKCGSENPNDARFCGGCGAPLEGPAPEPRGQPSEILRLVDPRGTAETVPGGLKWGVLAVTFLIPVVGLGMGLYYWFKGGSEEKAAVGRLWFFAALGLVILYSLIAGEGY